MSNEDDHLFDFHTAKDFHSFVRDALSGNDEQRDEMIELLKSEVHDLTPLFQSALWALDAGYLAEYFRKVEVRIGKATIGFGMEVRSDFNPDGRTEHERILIAKAITAVLRSGDIPAVRIGTRVFVHSEECEGNCGIEHGEIDPFANQISAFRREMNEVLGDENPPGEDGWSRWMGRG